MYNEHYFSRKLALVLITKQ